MHDQFDVTLEDGDLLGEVELTTTLIIAASESEEHLSQEEIDHLLGVTPRLLPLFVHADALADPAVTGTVQAMAESTGKDGFLRQQTAILGRPDSRPDLRAIACPTLVLAGREDQITPPELQLEMAAAIPDATLVLLPRCGHLSPLERPDAVTRQLLAWLDGPPAAP